MQNKNFFFYYIYIYIYFFFKYTNDKECQRKAYKYHKKEFKYFEVNKGLTPPIFLFMNQIISCINNFLIIDIVRIYVY